MPCTDSEKKFSKIEIIKSALLLIKELKKFKDNVVSDSSDKNLSKLVFFCIYIYEPSTFANYIYYINQNHTFEHYYAF